MKGQEAFHPIPERDRASRPRRGQKRLDVPGPPKERRQDLRGEADTRAAGTPSVREVGAALPVWISRSGACLLRTTRRRPCALEFGVRAEIRLYFGLDHLLQHPPRPVPQHQQQRIIGDTRDYAT